jgi:hypothetical protein
MKEALTLKQSADSIKFAPPVDFKEATPVE